MTQQNQLFFLPLFSAPEDHFILGIKILHLTPTNICCSLITGPLSCFTARSCWRNHWLCGLLETLNVEHDETRLLIQYLSLLWAFSVLPLPLRGHSHLNSISFYNRAKYTFICLGSSLALSVFSASHWKLMAMNSIVCKIYLEWWLW